MYSIFNFPRVFKLNRPSQQSTVSLNTILFYYIAHMYVNIQIMKKIKEKEEKKNMLKTIQQINRNKRKENTK